MDWFGLYKRAAAEFDKRIRQVKPGDWDKPTPDSEWNVRDLVNHVVGEALWIPVMMAGGTVEEVGNKFDGDLLGDDPLAVWEEGRDKAIAILEGTAPETLVHLSYGDASALEYASQMTIDTVIHTWDLARALGLDEYMDEDLVEKVYAQFKTEAEVWREAGSLGKAIEPADNASTQIKLLNLAGRSA